MEPHGWCSVRGGGGEYGRRGGVSQLDVVGVFRQEVLGDGHDEFLLRHFFFPLPVVDRPTVQLTCIHAVCVCMCVWTYHEDVQGEVEQAVPPFLRLALGREVTTALVAQVGPTHELVVVHHALWGRQLLTFLMTRNPPQDGGLGRCMEVGPTCK